MTSVRLEPAVARSRVKHSTTEPLHSNLIQDNLIFLPYESESSRRGYTGIDPLTQAAVDLLRYMCITSRGSTTN